MMTQVIRQGILVVKYYIIALNDQACSDKQRELFEEKKENFKSNDSLFRIGSLLDDDLEEAESANSSHSSTN